VPYITNLNSKIKTIHEVNIKYENISTLINLDDVNKQISVLEEISLKTLRKDYFLVYKIIMDIELKQGINFSPISKGFCYDTLKINSFTSDKTRGIKSATVVFAGSEYDLQNWLLYYNISNFTLIEYWIFDTLKEKDLQLHKDIMKDWFDMKVYYSEKDTKNDTLKSLYKLFLNSTTGKFGERVREETLIIKNSDLIEEPKSDVYTRNLPEILSLISFSRLYMSTLILKQKDKFIYCDTDSIALDNPDLNTIYKIYNIDTKQLGALSIDKEFTESIYMKPKTYIGICKHTNKVKATVAGCKPDPVLLEKLKPNFTSLLNNDKIIGKKIIKANCIDGVILLEKPFIFKNDEGGSNAINLKINITRQEYIKEFLKREFELFRETIKPNISFRDESAEMDNIELYNGSNEIYTSIVRTDE
jgi:hypothetical protein